jgi:hypothetical protein
LEPDEKANFSFSEGKFSILNQLIKEVKEAEKESYERRLGYNRKT